MKRDQPKPDIFQRSLPTPLDRRLYFRELITYLVRRGVGINRIKRIFNCPKDDIRKIHGVEMTVHDLEFKAIDFQGVSRAVKIPLGTDLTPLADYVNKSLAERLKMAPIIEEVSGGYLSPPRIIKGRFIEEIK